MVSLDEAQVRAAGGVPWRRRDGRVRLLVVHRPRYDDWSFPKGKLDPGEGWEQAAVREVFEETGIVGVLGTELSSTTYADRKGRTKLVRYWEMAVAADVGHDGDDEVDERRWVSADEARKLLSYERDAGLVDEVMGVVGATDR